MAGVTTPFAVKFADGTEVTSKYLPIDVLMAERKLGGVKDRNIETAFFACFNALKRQGVVDDTESFEDFIARVADLEENPVGNGAAPTGATPSPSSPTEPESPPAS